jgi:4-aminobutyrate--pyruvate transaminase
VVHGAWLWQPRIGRCAAEQMRRLPYTHLFGHKSNDLAIELSEKLKELVPCEASKILFCSSGSEANDMQVS